MAKNIWEIICQKALRRNRKKLTVNEKAENKTQIKCAVYSISVIAFVQEHLQKDERKVFKRSKIIIVWERRGN